jgi:hypothetical protein
MRVRARETGGAVCRKLHFKKFKNYDSETTEIDKCEQCEIWGCHGCEDSKYKLEIFTAFFGVIMQYGFSGRNQPFVRKYSLHVQC